MIVID